MDRFSIKIKPPRICSCSRSTLLSNFITLCDPEVETFARFLTKSMYIFLLPAGTWLKTVHLDRCLPLFLSRSAFEHRALSNGTGNRRQSCSALTQSRPQPRGEKKVLSLCRNYVLQNVFGCLAKKT